MCDTTMVVMFSAQFRPCVALHHRIAITFIAVPADSLTTVTASSSESRSGFTADATTVRGRGSRAVQEFVKYVSGSAAMDCHLRLLLS